MPTCPLCSHWSERRRGKETARGHDIARALSLMHTLRSGLASLTGCAAFLDFLHAIPRSNEDFSIF
jgi:hypothetical protein